MELLILQLKKSFNDILNRGLIMEILLRKLKKHPLTYLKIENEKKIQKKKWAIITIQRTMRGCSERYQMNWKYIILKNDYETTREWIRRDKIGKEQWAIRKIDSNERKYER